MECCSCVVGLGALVVVVAIWVLERVVVWLLLSEVQSVQSFTEQSYTRQHYCMHVFILFINCYGWCFFILFFFSTLICIFLSFKMLKSALWILFPTKHDMMSPLNLNAHFVRSKVTIVLFLFYFFQDYRLSLCPVIYIYLYSYFFFFQLNYAGMLLLFDSLPPFPISPWWI